MTKRNETVSNVNNSTITNTESHDTGVKLTNQSISTLTYLQEDNNDAINTWILTMYQIAGAIVLRSPDMPIPEKYEHIEQLFSVADMFDSLKAPKGGEDE